MQALEAERAALAQRMRELTEENERLAKARQGSALEVLGDMASVMPEVDAGTPLSPGMSMSLWPQASQTARVPSSVGQAEEMISPLQQPADTPRAGCTPNTCSSYAGSTVPPLEEGGGGERGAESDDCQEDEGTVQGAGAGPHGAATSHASSSSSAHGTPSSRASGRDGSVRQAAGKPVTGGAAPPAIPAASNSAKEKRLPIRSTRGLAPVR